MRACSRCVHACPRRARGAARDGLAALGVLGGSAAKWTNVVWPIKSRQTNRQTNKHTLLFYRYRYIYIYIYITINKVKVAGFFIPKTHMAFRLILFSELTSEDLFVKLMKKATMDVEFRFAGTMYRQTDGVAMGSPLGPVLANIFMGYCEQQIPRSNLPLFYRRYVDDTFAVFESTNKSEEFLTLLNNIHCSLKFTTEMEHENAIPFLDINVQRTGNELHRSIYRKKTFTGLYTRFDSFCPMNQKLSTLKSLVARAVKLCTPELLEQEMDKLRSIFMNNGFPIKIINKYIQQAMPPMTKDKQEGTPRRVTFKLPYIGNVSRGFSSRICETVKKAYPTTEPTVCFTTTHAFRKTPKEALPAVTKSYVIYQYTCSCAETYVGKTTQRLSERIKQHIPPNIATRKSNQADSAILAHIRNKPACVPTNAQERFRILARARSSYHLDILEAMYIRSLEPSLCAQKEFVKSLTLFT